MESTFDPIAESYIRQQERDGDPYGYGFNGGVDLVPMEDFNAPTRQVANNTGDPGNAEGLTPASRATIKDMRDDFPKVAVPEEAQRIGADIWKPTPPQKPSIVQDATTSMGKSIVSGSAGMAISKMLGGTGTTPGWAGLATALVPPIYDHWDEIVEGTRSIPGTCDGITCDRQD
ncbi:hypothetical protein [Fundidesulfovibrio agrisoli]|uniref:hypothetical protein n=1 Tax=Fundidesulfovibrio agrisoli TaxID=2922717 RepID=UPI001FAD2F79|nr:hypothetical protein [Fundidesulfovibrio agrisoli]